MVCFLLLVTLVCTVEQQGQHRRLLRIDGRMISGECHQLIDPDMVACPDLSSLIGQAHLTLQPLHAEELTVDSKQRVARAIVCGDHAVEVRTTPFIPQQAR